jgi:hypothetical protein
MRRRDFLRSAGLTVGYSLAVCADPSPLPSAERIAPPLDRAAALAAEPHMSLVELSCDVFVAGGGLAGVIRLHIQTTNGDKLARVFEVRCYG